VEDALKLAQRAESDAVRNQIGLFGQATETPALIRREQVAEWSHRERLNFEKEALGFYVSAHPLDNYERELRRIGKLSTADLVNARDGRRAQLAGVIQSVKLKNNKAGKRYATFSLEDREGVVECILWPEAYQKYDAIVQGNDPVMVKGKLDIGDERAQIIVDELLSLSVALTDAVREVRIRAPRARMANGDLERLKELLRRYSGQSFTYLHLGLEDGNEAVFLLGDDYKVSPTEAFVAELSDLLTPDAVLLR
jgi:DNA polymerase-3 subunit alpha